VVLRVGDCPVVNTLFLAYAVPVAFAFFLVNKFQHQTPAWPALVSVILDFVLVFAHPSFEVGRAYQGPVFSGFL
jgi:hypothetical protein